MSYPSKLKHIHCITTWHLQKMMHKNRWDAETRCEYWITLVSGNASRRTDVGVGEKQCWCRGTAMLVSGNMHLGVGRRALIHVRLHPLCALSALHALCALYALFTHFLRTFYALFTRFLRTFYALFTHFLRTFCALFTHFTHFNQFAHFTHFAHYTQHSLHNYNALFTHFLRTFYALWALYRRIFYALFAHFSRTLPTLPNLGTLCSVRTLTWRAPYRRIFVIFYFTHFVHCSHFDMARRRIFHALFPHFLRTLYALCTLYPVYSHFSHFLRLFTHFSHLFAHFSSTFFAHVDMARTV